MMKCIQALLVYVLVFIIIITAKKGVKELDQRLNTG